MSDTEQNETQQMPMRRGVYLVADTPLALHALAIEGGGGDKKLLSEAIQEMLSDDEVDDLINDLSHARVNDDG